MNSYHIENRNTEYLLCPHCGDYTLRFDTWEEHSEGWGFSNYRTECCGNAYCYVCHYDTSHEPLSKKAKIKIQRRKRARYLSIPHIKQRDYHIEYAINHQHDLDNDWDEDDELPF